MDAFARACRYGFGFSGQPRFREKATAKPRSHDDGPLNGPFLGGVGTANFSRSLDGRFDRWQLQQGMHLKQDVPAAFLAVAWRESGQRHYRRLVMGASEQELPWASLTYAALWPRVYEHYDHPDLPACWRLDYYSPMGPDQEAAGWPVTLFNLEVLSIRPGVDQLSFALVWPNLNGWQLMPLTSVERTGLHWPNQSHAGQYNERVASDRTQCHIRQSQRRFDRSDVSGSVMISACSDTAELNYQVSAKANQNETGVPYDRQPYTLAALEACLLENGRLPNDDTSWSAHWHEPLVSAISAYFDASPGRVTFCITLDWPLTRFGQGRLWHKAYTRKWGSGTDQTLAMALVALDRNDTWQDEIDQWHGRCLAGLDLWPDAVRGALINELSFLSGGGTVWVARSADPLNDSESHFQREDHFGWLEGFDSGYFYYNTLDLWVYAFPALTRQAPELAESVFSDYLDTVALSIERERPVYRTGDRVPMLVADKLPHDLGSAMEDPWVSLNGYVMRDDPNVWKDHNPAFIISFYWHRRKTGQDITADEYSRLVRLADFMWAQDSENLGFPRHDEFGDSTWDNLDMRGLSTYAGGLYLAAWAALSQLAGEQTDHDRQHRYSQALSRGQSTLESLWQGAFYRTNESGKYCNATMADALIGIYYARQAGLGDLIPLERTRQHLRSTFENNARQYHQGRYGPLLVAEPGQYNYGRDGGEELQVNEVIVGSAWILVAMLREYGLMQEAVELASAMVNHQYQNSGLQFRTPAAWDGLGRFRAPLNMRPLSIWWLAERSAP